MGNSSAVVRHDYENAFNHIISDIHADFWNVTSPGSTQIFTPLWSHTLDVPSSQDVWERVNSEYGEATADFYVAAFNEGHTPEVLVAMAKDFDFYLSGINSYLKAHGINRYDENTLIQGVDSALDSIALRGPVEYPVEDLGGMLAYLRFGDLPADAPHHVLDLVHKMTLEHFGISFHSKPVASANSDEFATSSR